MNIFTDKKDFIGHYDKGTEENSLQSLFILAKHIRTKLGIQGYLIDHYLSTFFKAANQLTAFHSAQEGFESAVIYQRLCLDLSEQTQADKEHPLYQKTLFSKIKDIKLKPFQEDYTRIDYRYIIMADDFLEDAVNLYIEKQKSKQMFQLILDNLPEN